MNDFTSKLARWTATPAYHLPVLLLLVGCWFFLGLGKLPLLEPDEGRNAEVAREMLATGDWVIPHFNTLAYLDKPVVFFWMVATSFRVFGISEWVARFPSALMGVATVLLAWLLARRMFDCPVALRTGMILATSPLLFGLARLVTFDMTFSFLITLAMAAFWLGEDRETRPRWLDALIFGAMAAATLTKGLAGAVVPVLSLVTYQAMRGRLRDLARVRWLLGVMVFLALTLAWFIAVWLRHPDFPRYALWQESLGRFATAQMRRTGSWGYYVPVYLAGFFPWSLFLVFAGWSRLKRWRELRQDAQKPVMFLLAWALVVLVFFSISRSKLPAYFLPAIIPLSILMARAWAEVRDAASAPDWVTAGFAAILGLGLLAAFAPRLPFWVTTETRLARRLSPSTLAAIKPCLLYSGFILIALAVVGRNLARRAQHTALATGTFALLVLTLPCLVLRWAVPLRTYAVSASSQALAKAILASAESHLPLYGYYYFRTSLPFYLRRPVGLITTDGSETTSHYVAMHLAELLGKAGPGAASAAPPIDPLLTDIHDLVSSSRGPMLVLARNTHVGELATSFGQIEPLWTGWRYSVWKIPEKKP